MLKLFKKKKNTIIGNNTSIKQDGDIVGPITVEQIHNEFDTAPDRLLRVANEIIGSKEGIKEGHSQIKEDYSRFEKLGFTSTPKAKRLKEDMSQYSDEVRELQLLKQGVEDVLYYKSAYPFLKFLTEKELDRICNKYGLSYAPVGRYIKDVPEKNLQEVLDAQELKKGDTPKNVSILLNITFWPDNPSEYIKFIKDHFLGKRIDLVSNSEYDFSNMLKNYGRVNNIDIPDKGCEYFFRRMKLNVLDRTGLFIAAPKEEFDLTGLEEKGLGFFPSKKVEIKDPVVFRYVRGGVQVLSKWGDEADDPMLQNEILN